MPISKKIILLTAEALKDRVLTFVERQTIVKAALKEGISESEVNQYIDNALQQRLKSYTKEELKQCPTCGAQIPLISNQCQFCGTMLTAGNVQTGYKNISGEEMQIIRRENLKTEQERQNITKCPDCGAPFPLISNVCTHCGYILHEKADSELNAKNLIQNIQTAINKLKTAPKPTFFKVFMFRIDIILFYFAAAFLILDCIGGYSSYICISASLLLTSFILLMTNKTKKDSPVEIADNEFYSALYSHEMYSRETDTLYGENPEAKQLLNNYAAEIAKVKKQRTTNRSILSALVLGLLAIPMVLYYFAPSTDERAQQNREKHLDIYEMSEFSKQLLPLPNYSVANYYSDFISANGNATLAFDVVYFDLHIEDLLGDTLYYKVRVDALNLVSTGQKNNNADTCRLRVFLWDKNKKPVAKDMYPIEILYHDNDDNYEKILTFGKGHYYGDFLSKKSTYNIKRLKEIADSAYYYTIY